MSSYVRISCVLMILYGYKSVSSALPFQVQDAIFDNGFITLALIDYVINLAIPLR